MGLSEIGLFPRYDRAKVNERVELPGASPEKVSSQVVMPDGMAEKRTLAQ
jgi:hypothetical protein